MVLKEEFMFYSTQTVINRIDFRIHMLLSRGEEMNKRLVNALKRERRNILEREKNNDSASMA